MYNNCDAFDLGSLLPDYIHLKILFVGTDQGGDQTGRDGIMEYETDTMPFVIYWNHYCWRHQNALSTKGQLKRLHNGNFWRALAKTINTWRNPGGPTKLKRIYDQNHPDGGRASVLLKSVPPKALKEKWNYTHAQVVAGSGRRGRAPGPGPRDRGRGLDPRHRHVRLR